MRDFFFFLSASMKSLPFVHQTKPWLFFHLPSALVKVHSVWAKYLPISPAGSQPNISSLPHAFHLFLNFKLLPLCPDWVCSDRACCSPSLFLFCQCFLTLSELMTGNLKNLSFSISLSVFPSVLQAYRFFFNSILSHLKQWKLRFSQTTEK